jgi:protocatechuate 3,4-dioxygenase beta subunit
VRFRSVLPVAYPVPTDGPVGQWLAASGRHPCRSAHVHFKIEAPRERDAAGVLRFAAARQGRAFVRRR